MNYQAIRVIYAHEMKRFFSTIGQSIASPVISTALYFIVFGAAIGSRIQEVDGIAYGSFIVPGMLMLSLLTQSMSNASFGIFFQKFTGTIYEIMSAPISASEIVIGFVGAATTKAMIIGVIILVTAHFFVDFSIAHPIIMLLFFVLSCLTFSMFGFAIGLWAENFEKLQVIPLLVITPLVFLGGSFYSIDMLPPVWQSISLFNPVLYLISGFRWSFFEVSDVSVGISLLMISLFFILCLSLITWMFKTGYKLKS